MDEKSEEENKQVNDEESKDKEVTKEDKVETKKLEEKTEEKKEEKKEEKGKQKEEKPEPIKKEKPKEPRKKISRGEWYNKNYKKLLFVSILILVVSLAYLGFFYTQHGDIMFKDVTLTGGTVITVYTGSIIDIPELNSFLQDKVGSVRIRTIEDIATRRQIAFVVETKADAESLQEYLEEYLDYKLDSSNSSIEITGASLSQSFYRQLVIALILAFVFMAIVIFIIFRNLVPSLAVILAAVTDIVGALAIANLFGFHMSTAGIAAFLMLIGYSVDTDVMLTTKVLRRRGEAPLNTRIKSSLKTGLTMTLTSLLAVLVGFFVIQSPVIKQIFFILSAGLFIDLIATWFGNAAILKWYCEKKKIS